MKILAHDSQVCNISRNYQTIASSDSKGIVNIWDIKSPEVFTTKKFFKDTSAKGL